MQYGGKIKKAHIQVEDPPAVLLSCHSTSIAWLLLKPQIYLEMIQPTQIDLSDGKDFHRRNISWVRYLKDLSDLQEQN